MQGKWNRGIALIVCAVLAVSGPAVSVYGQEIHSESVVLAETDTADEENIINQDDIRENSGDNSYESDIMINEVLDETESESEMTTEKVEIEETEETALESAKESVEDYEAGNEAKISAFVKRFYQLILQREPVNNEEAGWVSKLMSQQMEVPEIAEGFFYSPEFLGRNLDTESIVRICYRTFLNREADRDGMIDWMVALDRGSSMRYVLSGFIMSQEFSEICSDYGLARGTIASDENRDQNMQLTRFVYQCYTTFLGRNKEQTLADIDGINTWTGRLLSDMTIRCAREVAEGFVFSEEFTNAELSDREYITRLYRGIFGRQPDTGINNWLQALSNGQSRKDIFKGFIYSDEFKSMVGRFGMSTEEVVETPPADEKEEEHSLLYNTVLSEDDTYMLLCLVTCEADYGSYDVSLGVANVVLNRMKSSAYPDSIYGVIFDTYNGAYQFVPAAGALQSRMSWGVDAIVETFPYAYKAVMDALKGQNNIGNRIGFATPEYVYSWGSWTKDWYRISGTNTVFYSMLW